MPKKEDRVILDTNLWISFLLTTGFVKLDSIFENPNIKLVFSKELLEEFIEVSQRPKFRKYFSLTDLQDLLFSIKEQALFVPVKSTVTVCRDPKDNFLLALAKDSKATHLITGDKDLLELKTFGKTKIVTIARYLDKI